LTSLGHPSKFQRVSRLCSVTARHSASGRQPNSAALKRGANYIRQGGYITLGTGPHSSYILSYPDRCCPAEEMLAFATKRNCMEPVLFFLYFFVF